MRILVTGHLGTIGTPLFAELQSRGHDVTGVDIRHAATGERADISEYRQLQRVIETDEPDLVYHLAAEFGRHNGEDYYEQVWRTNVVGTKNLIRLQERHGFKMVFASSSEVYGERDGVLREDLPIRLELLKNDYAITKAVNEQQIANSGLETMVLRFFNAYGPGEHYHRYRSVVCLFAHSVLNGLPYTVYRNYWRVFQYIGDFIPTLANAADRFVAGETVNIGGHEYRSVADLDQLVRDAVGAIEPRVTYLDSDRHNVVSKRPDILKARALLDHAPRMDLEEGIRRTVEWMSA